VFSWRVGVKTQGPINLVDVSLLPVVGAGCKTGLGTVVDLHPAMTSEAAKSKVRVRRIGY